MSLRATRLSFHNFRIIGKNDLAITEALKQKPNGSYHDFFFMKFQFFLKKYQSSIFYEISQFKLSILLKQIGTIYRLTRLVLKRGIFIFTLFAPFVLFYNIFGVADE